MKKVSIRFCGGCNPRIDRGLIAGRLRAALAEKGCEVVFNQPDADAIIYLNGCAADCASRYNPPPAGTAVVNISAGAVDGKPVPEDELALCALDKVFDYLQVNSRGASS